MYKLTLHKIIGHLKTIHTHRKWVRYYCFLAGIPDRGLTHDLSKYSPKEFWQSARYWTGIGSPIVAAKQDKGFSAAWLHHRGRNTHHWEYWYDDFDEGGKTHLIPEKDFVELVCDSLGAARAYLKHNFSYYKELEWWKEKRFKFLMHKKNKEMLDVIFHTFADLEVQNRHFQIEDDKNIEALIKDKFIQKTYREILDKE